MTALISIEVWRDSASSAFVQVLDGLHIVDRVEVIAGDCLDVPIEPGMWVWVSAGDADAGR
jgi:hypothetical protein